MERIFEVKPLVSVVIPVYNVEKYIAKCLESVVGQTYDNLEIIVVNDGSPDDSERIIKKFAGNDARFKYIKRENGGLGAARNTGIKNATGEYICFIDSDDWIDKSYVETLVAKSIKDNADIVVCNMEYVFPDIKERPRTPKISEEVTISGEEALKREFIGSEYRFHAPNKFCKRCLFVDNDITFPEGKVYEDVMTTYKLFIYAERVSLVPADLYFYLQSRAGSIMHNSIKMNRFDDMYLALSNIESNPFVKSINADTELEVLFATNIISLVNYIYPLVGEKDKASIEPFRQKIDNALYRKYADRAIKNSKVGKAVRIRTWLIYHHFYFYCHLMKLLKRL